MRTKCEHWSLSRQDEMLPMPALPEPNAQSESDRLEAAANEAIATCGGDMKSAIRALIPANEFLEWELVTNVSAGYLRGVKYGRFNCYSG